tara:strand:+ start:609 stop:1463 length:855 start_codon:yes stop_codon:yes gene_type:complete
MANVNFVTFADKNFTLQKKHLINLAKVSGNFNNVYGLGFKDLEKSFVSKYSKILRNEKGAGFWIWKFQVIKQVLSNLEKDSLLVYSDAGSTFNLGGQKRFDEYIEMLLDSPFATLRFQNSNIEKFWTSKEVFQYFNLNVESNEGNSEQYLAGHLILKNNYQTLDQLNEFEKVLDYDVNLITDKYSKDQISGFKQSRHDQSIFSLISKIHGCVELGNEVWFKNNLTEQYNYPFLALQQGNYSFWQKIKFYAQFKKNINRQIFFGDPVYFYQKPSMISRFKHKFKK